MDTRRETETWETKGNLQVYNREGAEEQERHFEAEKLAKKRDEWSFVLALCDPNHEEDKINMS